MLEGKGKGGRVGQRESPSGTEVSPCLRVANLQKIFFLSLFWRQALTALRELTLSRTQLSLEGASSQPIWDNPHIPPPQIPSLFRDRWESLQVTVQHNLYSNLECTQLYTNEENMLYIDIEMSFHYFQNKKINNASSFPVTPPPRGREAAAPRRHARRARPS
jgi:hypothetical protein